MTDQMTIEQLEARIAELMRAANGLTGPERVLLRIEIRNLENEIDGAANDDILRRLNEVVLPDLQKIDAQIDTAKRAVTEDAKREAISVALRIIRTGLGLVL